MTTCARYGTPWPTSPPSTWRRNGTVIRRCSASEARSSWSSSLARLDRSRSTRRSSQSIAASRSEEHTSELQSLMRISYAVFCLKKKKHELQQNIQIKDHTKQKHITAEHIQ